MPLTTLTDEELVQNLRSQSREAFGELYARHKIALFDYCCRTLNDRDQAEDAVHEVFLRAWKNIHQLNDQHLFRSWIFSIARHYALNQIRNRKPFDELSEDCLVDDEDPLDLFIRNERSASLTRLLDMMRPAYQELIILKDYEDLSYREIAIVTGLSVPSVRVHLFRARKALAKMYLKNYGENER